MGNRATDQYRQHADDAERAAEIAQNGAAKELYRQVALRWRETADHAEEAEQRHRRKKLGFRAARASTSLS